MAMGACKECGKVVSTTAETCPNCGANHPAPYPLPQPSPGARFLAWCLMVLLIGGGATVVILAVWLTVDMLTYEDPHEEVRRLIHMEQMMERFERN